MYYVICAGTIFEGFPTRAQAERFAGIMLSFRTYRIVKG